MEPCLKQLKLKLRVKPKPPDRKNRINSSRLLQVKEEKVAKVILKLRLKLKPSPLKTRKRLSANSSSGVTNAQPEIVASTVISIGFSMPTASGLANRQAEAEVAVEVEEAAEAVDDPEV